MKRIAYASVLLFLLAIQAEASRVVASSFLPMTIDLDALTPFHASGIYYGRMQTAQHISTRLIMISK